MSEVAPPAPTEGAPPPATPPQDWTSSFNDETKGYVQNKGFKDPGSVLESYRNLEKLMGVPQEKLLKLPDKEDDPAWAGIFEKLGKPKDAKEYQLEIPKEGGDEKFAEAAKNWFHELGLSKKQGESLVKKWNEHTMTGAQAMSEAMLTRIKEQDTSLRKEWGTAYDKQMDLSSKAMNKFGISDEEGSKIGASLPPELRVKLVKAFAAAGTGLGEDNFIGGTTNGTFGGAMTPAQALSKISALRGDTDFVRRFTNGGVKEKEEMANLHRMAYPEGQ